MKHSSASNANAALSLVFGTLSVFLPGLASFLFSSVTLFFPSLGIVLAITGIVFAHESKTDIIPADKKGHRLLFWGMVTSVLGLLIQLLSVLIVIGYVSFYSP